MNALAQSLKRLGYFIVHEYDRLLAGIYLMATLTFLYVFLQ